MQETDASAIRLQAMNLLARREHLRRELSLKLAKRFGDAPVIDHVLDQLEQENLLSDARFTEAYIRHRSGRGYGPDRIRQELRQKGVASGLLEDAMAAVEVDWTELAREVRLKKFGPGEPGDFREKARQLRFLNYRGFGGDFAGAAVDPDPDA